MPMVWYLNNSIEQYIHSQLSLCLLTKYQIHYVAGFNGRY